MINHIFGLLGMDGFDVGGRRGTCGGAREPEPGRCGTIGWFPIMLDIAEAAPIACDGVIPICFIPALIVWAPWYACWACWAAPAAPGRGGGGRDLCVGGTGAGLLGIVALFGGADRDGTPPPSFFIQELSTGGGGALELCYLSSFDRFFDRQNDKKNKPEETVLVFMSPMILRASLSDWCIFKSSSLLSASPGDSSIIWAWSHCW